jgi:hypothetical protein
MTDTVSGAMLVFVLSPTSDTRPAINTINSKMDTADIIIRFFIPNFILLDSLLFAPYRFLDLHVCQ